MCLSPVFINIINTVVVICVVRFGDRTSCYVCLFKYTLHFCGLLPNNGSLKFEITAKRLYAASQRVL